MNATQPIRVLAVDDSAMFRRVLADIIGQEPSFQLVGCATDPYQAKEILVSTPVDVMTLDVETPRMDGITFLKLVMESRPMPIIIISSHTAKGTQKAVEALLAGAFESIGKPTTISEKNDFAVNLIESIKQASKTTPRRRPALLTPAAPTPHHTSSSYDPRQIIAFGASTGGTQALTEVLTHMADNLPPIVIVQHIPATFSTSFAQRLNELCAMEVREAKDGDDLHAGLALLAPGGFHMEVDWVRDHYRVRLHEGPKVEYQRPAVDVLFSSLARSAGANTVAALLTGMGKDGAVGMKELHDLKAYTIAQDMASCVVYGMPKQAVELGAVDAIVSLEHIADRIEKALEARRKP